MKEWKYVEKNPNDLCPFLGLDDDSETSLAFPSNWNNCYHNNPPVPVNLDHQREYCLSEKHYTCKVYLNPSIYPFPDELKNIQNIKPFRKKSKKIFSAMIILISFGALFILYFFSSKNLPVTTNPLPTGTFTSTQKQETIIPTYTKIFPTTTAALPPTPKPTEIGQATISPVSARNPHNIETLIGLNFIFKIHRNRNSDSLSTLAIENGTTEAAILAVNYSISLPLKPRTLLIIPVNRQDVSDLPKFEPYYVEQDTTLEAIAEQLGVDIYQLKFYNGLLEYSKVFKGEWLVIPRQNTNQ